VHGVIAGWFIPPSYDCGQPKSRPLKRRHAYYLQINGATVALKRVKIADSNKEYESVSSQDPILLSSKSKCGTSDHG